MTKKASTQPTNENKQQVAAFRKAARELGCEDSEDSEDRFKSALRTVGKAKPQPPQEPKKHKGA